MLFYTIEFFRGFLKIFLPDQKKKAANYGHCGVNECCLLECEALRDHLLVGKVNMNT